LFNFFETMTIAEFFGAFSASEYRARVKRMSREEFIREHAIARSKVCTTVASAVVGSGAASFTLRFLLFGLAIGLRPVSCNSEKLHILEQRLEEEDWEATGLRKRDFALCGETHCCGCCRGARSRPFGISLDSGLNTRLLRS
jgi:hypothetical protein